MARVWLLGGVFLDLKEMIQICDFWTASIDFYSGGSDSQSSLKFDLSIVPFCSSVRSSAPLATKYHSELWCGAIS